MNTRTMKGLLLKIKSTPPMAMSNERKPSTTRNTRYGDFDMAVGLPSLNTELSPEPLWCAVYANSSPLNLGESATQMSRKIRDPGTQNS
jgi:hypothetical protein